MRAPFRPLALIPVYDHHKIIGDVVNELLARRIPVLLVDDGSHALCAGVLREIARREPNVALLTLERNSGKGAACLRGMTWAHAHEFSHVIQIDADGQHCLDDLDNLVAAARKHPGALVCGYPQYDESVPKSRLYGRTITNFWVHVNTIERSVQDAMCGFRVYPLAPLMPHLHELRSPRMGFDPEILVRAIWAGIPVENVPVRVSYPADGVSHFRMVRDNIAISLMHARLFCGMTVRAPRLIRRRLKK
jgi:glycosyltransferase involved in cell wall biosynthesis